MFDDTEGYTIDQSLFRPKDGDKNVPEEMFDLLNKATDGIYDLQPTKDGYTSHAQVEVEKRDTAETVTVSFWDHHVEGHDAETNKDHAIGDEVDARDFQHRRAEVTFWKPEDVKGDKDVWVVRTNVHDYALELDGINPQDLLVRQKAEALATVGDKYMEQAIQLLAKQQDDE